MKTLLPLRTRPPHWIPAVLLLLATTVCLRADVVFAWNELLLRAAVNAPVPVPPQLEARVFAMMHVAMDEAVSSVANEGEEPATIVAGQRSAAIAAAHAVLLRLLPESAKVFDALAQRHLEAISEGPGKQRGVDAGNRAASRILALRENDRWVELTVFHPVASPRPESSEAVGARLVRGEKLPASPWLEAVPFGLKSVEQFPVREVRSVNRNGTMFVDYTLTDASVFKRVDQPAAMERAELFWTHRPVILWNRIVRQMCVGRATDLSRQARVLALLNIAIADATLASLHWRHTVGNWRMFTTEHWQVLNGMPPQSTDIVAQVDNHGTELVRQQDRQVLVPPTAHYPSPAATIAGAVQGVLANFFRTDRIDFELPKLEPAGDVQPALHLFSSVSSVARECAFVASLNGIHSREACVAGYYLGDSIGNYIGKRISVRSRGR
jgi:hypothetical protein